MIESLYIDFQAETRNLWNVHIVVFDSEHIIIFYEPFSGTSSSKEQTEGVKREWS